jgi:hypothetical protein
VNQLTYFQKIAISRINYYLFDEDQDKLGEGQFGRLDRASDTGRKKKYLLKFVQLRK